MPPQGKVKGMYDDILLCLYAVYVQPGLLQVRSLIATLIRGPCAQGH